MNAPAQPLRSVQLLPELLANQIAAGEVVERPASAVKELVENSLDAGATRCDVEVEGGGVALLRVADDGHGMSAEDARLALLRHATSKLRTLEDLRCIGTFGFRGEALPSIASVSRFSLRTRRRDTEEGIEVRMNGAEPLVAPIGAPVGTVVEARDLFHNVPARRKFLRSAGTESAHISETLEGLALSRPDVTFTLRRDGRLVREWLRAPSRRERAIDVTGLENPICCEGERGPLRVEAYLGKPEQARNGAAGLRLLVNGRSVRDRALAASLAHAYGSLLEKGQYPRGVVYLDLPAELVDVNVHPQKAEVRFVEPRAIADALHAIARRALEAGLRTPALRAAAVAAQRPEPSASSSTAPPDAAARLPAPSREEASPWAPSAAPTLSPSTLSAMWPTAGAEAERAEAEPTQAVLSTPGTSPQPGADRSPRPPAVAHRAFAHPSPPPQSPQPCLPLPEPEDPLLAGLAAALASNASARRSAEGAPVVHEAHDSFGASEERELRTPWGTLRFLVQIRRTYLLCENNDGIFLLDQHAASERVLFHRLSRAFTAQTIATQSLLFPTELDVTEEEAELVEQEQARFAKFGLGLQRAGATKVQVLEVPRILERTSPERLARELLSELRLEGSRGFSDAVDRALATMACHAAVRAGDLLGPAEVRTLLQGLDEVTFAGYCPHGRPIVSFLGFGELERKVGRR